jgi:3-hydroxyacyl-[acyl-carrier-protein] dehydratase
VKQDVERSLVAFERTAEGFTARFRFAADLEVFRGHFPGHPLVPGVFLIEAVRCGAERALGRTLDIAEVVDARFHEEVGPDAGIEVVAVLDGDMCSARLGAQTRIRLLLS